MSTNSTSRRFGAASLALAASVLLAASGVSAMAQNGTSAHPRVHAREFRATAITQDPARWVAPSGARILGGFAGPDDLINSVTGEVRSR